MYRFFRPWIFLIDPELAHRITLVMMRAVGFLPPVRSLLDKLFFAPAEPVQTLGLTFKNPVGLAAGYDKDGLAWRGLACLGFSHIEIGTVTLRDQQGNPSPRIFRLVEDQALINRMGFPGRGANFVVQQLKGLKPSNLVLGVNIGKNKNTSLEDAANEYATLVQIFAPHADYLAINVSSPNTMGLRELQSKSALKNLLTHVSKSRQTALKGLNGKNLPILVKLAPDLDLDELDQALDVIHGTDIDGIIATNTTLRREKLVSSLMTEAGGLSGLPLFTYSLNMVKHITRESSSRLPVIAAGGIVNRNHAQAMLDAGASLVQVYTGLIYSGPGLVHNILTGLRKI